MVIYVYICYGACIWSIRGYTSNYELQSKTDKRKIQLGEKPKEIQVLTLRLHII